MKISAVRTRPFRINLSRPIGDANSPHGRRGLAGLIVSVHCGEPRGAPRGAAREAAPDEGATGVAIAPADAGDAIAALAELLVGSDPRGVRGLWQRMNDALFKAGAVGVAGDAMGSLDVALWDLKGKLAGEPLWRLLGAAEPRVRAYASGLDLPLSDTDLEAYYRRMAAAGVRAGKLKVGLDLQHDLRRLAIVRDALSAGGAAPALMIDANEYWSPKQAVRRVAVFEERFDLTWVEEPARRWDYAGLRTVTRAIRAAVATGENLDYLAQYRALVEHGAVDIVQVGTNAGGITGALQVAELAHAFDLPVAMMNSPGSFLAHVAAALPNHLMIEVLDAGRGRIFDRDLELRDGYVHIGERPGLGMVLDRERLAAAEAQARETPAEDAPPSAAGGFAGRRAGAGLIEEPPDRWP